MDYDKLGSPLPSLNRRIFLGQIGAAALAISLPWVGRANSHQKSKTDVKAFCLDFNWGDGEINSFARPGLWADANPKQHIKWYSDLGCNVVQTFAVSCNGYAWYKGGVVPEQPGLKFDFLPEMVNLGHKKGLKVMGYFCIGANTKWALDHPDENWGSPSSTHIPFTKRYLAYLRSVIKDAFMKTDMDGFMIDWVWNPGTFQQSYRWLPCEQEMYYELMGEKFPGKDKLPDHMHLEYRRRAIDRCWQTIRQAAKEAKPDSVIWLSCSIMDHPDVVDSNMFKEVDWLMNEAGSLEHLRNLEGVVGENTTLLTCLARWNKQDALTLVPQAMEAGYGLYGFAKPSPNSLLPDIDTFLKSPVDQFKEDERNIAVIARAYNGLDYDYVKR